MTLNYANGKEYIKNTELQKKEDFLENFQNIINISKIPKTNLTGIVIISIETEELHEAILKDVIKNMSFFDIVTKYNNKFAGVRAQISEEFDVYVNMLDTNLKKIIELYGTPKNPIKYKLITDIVESDEDSKEFLEKLEKEF